MIDSDVTEARRAAVALAQQPGRTAFCGPCGRPIAVCDADPRGCGSTPAEDEAPVTNGKRPVFSWDDRGITTDAPPPKQETWRDREPLL